MLTRQYYVYIVMNKWRTTSYIGVTNNLIRRIEEHRTGLVESFTKRYRCFDLVYYEACEDVIGAIEREKELKGWSRQKKILLVRKVNPEFRDLLPECVV